MASIATTLGLRAPPFPNLTTNHAATYLSVHFFLAYIVMAPRHLKQIYGIDHQASPREDLAKYGEAAVRSGKITQKQLDMMRRNESAQANSVENYSIFVGAMSMATFAGVERESVNLAGLIYTVSRVAYNVIYLLVDHPIWSMFRTVPWWTGNIACLWLLRKAGKKLNMV